MGSTQNRLSRRLVLGSSAVLGAGLAAGTVSGASAADGPSAAAAEAQWGHGGHGPSVRKAVGFLQGVTDAYRTSGKRLAQSYYDGGFPKDFGGNDIAFVYDQALTIIALLAGRDVDRASAIGDALIYAQEHDPDFSDGRLRQAYHADTFVNADGTAHYGYEFGLSGTAVGDMAWPGTGLAQLYRATRDDRYKAAAVRIGKWIKTFTYSDTGLKGFTFGETDGLRDHKSTEHNIDVYAFFQLLAQIDSSEDWRGLARHAWEFVEREWNAADGFFWTGSDDGAAINKNPLQLPEDVQSWSWLAKRDNRYRRALDWAYGNLASTDTPLRQNSALTGNQRVTGAVFASGTLLTDPTKRVGGQQYTPFPDPAGVWFEGTGQLALALRLRDHHDGCAGPLLSSLAWAQRTLAKDQKFNNKRIDGGIPAASSPIDTGFNFAYYPHLHVAATSWAIFAALKKNPYVF